ncbi:MAG: urease accessory protein UreE [Sneathiella sp.]|nr:urease accessory protein UreE [Sneathiella sp.]
MKTALKYINSSDLFDGIIAETVTLDFDSRRRRRIRLTTDQGNAFLLNLPEVETLREGGILVLDSGEGIAVKAAAEPVVDIVCAKTAELVRVAWHLGNRHLPTQLLEDRLRIRQDHVIEEMVIILGATPKRVNAPFDPEGGAYGHGETTGHGHSHGEENKHGHSHDH